ncbi:MAG: hypothetical protein ACKOCE_06890, partial [Acidimicrobiia bacterium]
LKKLSDSLGCNEFINIAFICLINSDATCVREFRTTFRTIPRTMSRRAVNSSAARCHHHDSVTINSDPLADFGRLVELDRAYFESKWSS